MVRTLPWLKNGKGQQGVNPPKAKRRRVDNSASPPPRSPSGRSARSTSAAPLQSASSRSSAKPQAAAPKQDDIYMVAGLSSDDGYIMVEDQFLTIARSFTSTLHSAEYQRRKALAATATAAHPFPNSIPRHVSQPPSTMPTERKVANRATAHKRSVITATGDAEMNTAGVSDDDDDQDEEDAVRAMLKAEGDNASGTVWANGALGRLMRTAPTKVERKLAVGKGATRTRAAAGFKIGNAGSPTKSQRTSQGVPSSPLRGKGGYGSDDHDDGDGGNGNFDYDVNEDLAVDDETTDDGSDGLDVLPPPKAKKAVVPSSTKISMASTASSRSSKPRIYPPSPSPPPPPTRTRPPPTMSLLSSPTHPKPILRKPKAAPVIVLSSDDEGMDDAEAERWKKRNQEQQRREEAKAAKEKARAEEEKEKRKQRSSVTAPVSFLGLRYS